MAGVSVSWLKSGARLNYTFWWWTCYKPTQDIFCWYCTESIVLSFACYIIWCFIYFTYIFLHVPLFLHGETCFCECDINQWSSPWVFMTEYWNVVIYFSNNIQHFTAPILSYIVSLQTKVHSFRIITLKNIINSVVNIIPCIFVINVYFKNVTTDLQNSTYVLKCLISIFSVRVGWRWELFSRLMLNLYFMI